MAYVPKYMGDVAQYINSGVQYKGQIASDIPLTEEQKHQNLQTISEIANHPVNQKVPYLWSISLNVQMAGEITRVCSRNHKVQVELSPDQKRAKITLDQSERETAPHKDFVLLIRDSEINNPVGFTSTNEHNDQAILVEALPDLRPPKIKQAFFRQKEGLDTDPEAIYDRQLTDQEAEELEVEPKLSEYIFLIDRSGSMSG